MNDQPTLDDLLDGARESLLEKVLPVVPDDRRLEVLMIANALAIARRMAGAGELALRSELRGLETIYRLAPEADLHGPALVTKLHELKTRLARDIRGGAFDRSGIERDAVAAQLWNVTVEKLRETRPKMLKAEGIE
jgi:Domain of unknown function (DUF6285)